jgi:hypothetical protein
MVRTETPVPAMTEGGIACNQGANLGKSNGHVIFFNCSANVRKMPDDGVAVFDAVLEPSSEDTVKRRSGAAFMIAR